MKKYKKILLWSVFAVIANLSCAAYNLHVALEGCWYLYILSAFNLIAAIFVTMTGIRVYIIRKYGIELRENMSKYLDDWDE